MVKRIPWWAVVSAAAAPVLLTGGWTVAQQLQPTAYDPVRDTISALAARGASDRWVMTSALACLGGCHIVTALGLAPARRAGRVVLAGGGLATVLVAAFPQPVRGNSVAHTVAAGVAFGALSVWPLLGASRRPGGPMLSWPWSAGAAITLVGLVVWFVVEIHGGQRGLAERAAAGGQALWPLAVVVAARRAARSR